MTSSKEANTQHALNQNYKTFMGARVLWPPDVDDDILEGAILQTQALLKTYDINKDGQTVKKTNYKKKYQNLK